MRFEYRLKMYMCNIIFKTEDNILYSVTLTYRYHYYQVVPKRCRLSLLTNSAPIYESKCGGRGELRGLIQWVQLCTSRDMEPIFNLWLLCIWDMGLPHPLCPPSPASKLSLFLSLPVYRRSSLLTEEGGIGRGRSQIIQSPDGDSLVLL